MAYGRNSVVHLILKVWDGTDLGRGFAPTERLLAEVDASRIQPDVVAFSAAAGTKSSDPERVHVIHICSTYIGPKLRFRSPSNFIRPKYIPW